VRKVLDDFPGVGYAFTQPIEMRVSEMLTGVRGDLAIKIFGDDQAQLNASADAIVDILKGIRGAEDVYTPRNEGAQYYRLVADPMSAGRVGISVDELQRDLRTQVNGVRVGTVFEGARRVPLILRGSDQLRSSPAEFANLRFALPNGEATGLG